MIGGMVSSTVLTLLVIPAIYGLVKGWGLPAAAGLSGRHPTDGGANSGTVASSPIVSEPVQ